VSQSTKSGAALSKSERFSKREKDNRDFSLSHRESSPITYSQGKQ